MPSWRSGTDPNHEYRDLWEEKEKYLLEEHENGSLSIISKDGMAILIDEDDKLASTVIKKMLDVGVQVVRRNKGVFIDVKTRKSVDVRAWKPSE